MKKERKILKKDKLKIYNIRQRQAFLFISPVSDDGDQRLAQFFAQRFLGENKFTGIMHKLKYLHNLFGGEARQFYRTYVLTFRVTFVDAHEKNSKRI